MKANDVFIPCSVCGKSPTLYTEYDDFIMECECGVGVNGDTLEEVITNWKKRTTELVLKPCPICGSTTQFWTGEEGWNPDFALVRCTNKCCPLYLEYKTSFEDVADNWNQKVALNS